MRTSPKPGIDGAFRPISGARPGRAVMARPAGRRSGRAGVGRGSDSPDGAGSSSPQMQRGQSQGVVWQPFLQAGIKASPSGPVMPEPLPALNGAPATTSSPLLPRTTPLSMARSASRRATRQVAADAELGGIPEHGASQAVLPVPRHGEATLLTSLPQPSSSDGGSRRQSRPITAASGLSGFSGGQLSARSHGLAVFGGTMQ